MSREREAVMEALKDLDAYEAEAVRTDGDLAVFMVVPRKTVAVLRAALSSAVEGGEGCLACGLVHSADAIATLRALSAEVRGWALRHGEPSTYTRENFAEYLRGRADHMAGVYAPAPPAQARCEADGRCTIPWGHPSSSCNGHHNPEDSNG